MWVASARLPALPASLPLVCIELVKNWLAYQGTYRYELPVCEKLVAVLYHLMGTAHLRTKTLVNSI